MTQLSSGIGVIEESPRFRAIQGGSTAVLGAVGITQRGPFEATLVTSAEDFRRVYGDPIVAGDLAHAVNGFFENGGRFAYIKRVVHYTDIHTLATKTSAAADVDLLSAATAPTSGGVTGTVVGPFAMTTGMTLVVSINGAGDLTATFTGVAATRLSTTGTYALSNNQTLTLSVDSGPVQTVTFLTAQFVAIGAATPAEVAAVINASITGASASVDTNAVRITSDRKGTGSGINVTGGTSNAALLFTTGNVAGTGNVSNLAAVTVAEVETIVEAAVTGSVVTNVGGAVRIASSTTGVSSTVTVNASSTADTLLGIDNATHAGTTGAAVACVNVAAKTDGTFGNTLTVVVSAPTSGEATEFNLVVEEDGVTRETWLNMSVTSTAENYHETVINAENSGSNYITTSELVASLVPAPATAGPMTGGADGLASLSDTDFIGSGTSKAGIRGFDILDDVNLLSVPDRITSAVHAAMVVYCETTRKGSIYPILDCPAGFTPAQMKTYVQTTAGLYNLSEFGEINYPQIKVLNPNKTVFGNAATVVVPSSGHMAGMYARRDNAQLGGVYTAPAGTENGIIIGCQGFESDYTQEETNRDLLYPVRVNPLRTIGGLKVRDGVRTLKGNGNFPTVSERRGVIFIEQSVKAGLEFARFRNNDEALRAEVNRTVTAFLLTQMNAGAFRSRVPSEAFFVDTSETLNTPAVVFAGKLFVRIGLATQKPAEFITILVSQDTRAVEAAL